MRVVTFRPEPLRVAALASFCLVAGCSTPDQSPTPEAVRAAQTIEVTRDGWTTGDPAEAGFDPSDLDRLVADIEAGELTNIHALLIEHDGSLVFERYFSGSDERWGQSIPTRSVGPDSIHDLRSVSKSVTSALLGIALSGDFDEAVGRQVVEVLPSVSVDAPQNTITLHQVLTMTMGVEWNEMTVPYTDTMNDEIALYRAPDPAQYVMSRPQTHEPGSTWYYSGGSTQLLAAIVSHLTGQRLDDYARDVLFEPLGITDFEWLGPDGWAPDNPAAMSGLRLRARDLAKIGSVYLHDGQWQGRQIVPARWVELTSTRHVAEIGEWSDDGIWGYGYQWWIGDLPSGERVVAGVGNGNQRLFVLPDEGLVVTVMAGEYNRFNEDGLRILRRVLAARSGDR